MAQTSIRIAQLPDDDDEESSIDDLMNGVEQESKIAILAYRLLHGISLDGHFVKLIKWNDCQTESDEAKYRVDFVLSVNQTIIGYLDIEKKPKWQTGGWPYPKTNIALHPMKHWQQGHFREGRYTKKLQRFSEKPDTSFWVGIRADWQAAWVLRARDIFGHGQKAIQPTRYNAIPLPIIEVSNRWGTFCDNADDFTDYILEHLEEAGILNG